MRSSMISNVSYEVTVALPKGDNYFGHVLVNFHVKKLTNDVNQLFIDFLG